MTFATETGYQHFVVFFNEVETTVIRDESRDLLSIFQELYAHTFTDSRVRLLGFNTNLNISKSQKTIVPYPQQFLSRARPLRKDSLSNGFQDGPFCIVCQPIFGYGGAYGAYELYGYQLVYHESF